MNIIIPTILIALSIGASFLYISPEYTNLNDDIQLRSQYIENIQKIESIKTKYNNSVDWKNKIKNSDKDRLTKILPTSFDNVTFILDVNRLAVKDGVVINKVNTEKESSDITTYAVYKVSLNFSSPYSSNVLQFFSDLENSLTLFDVTDMKIVADEKGQLTYDFSLNTYAMK